MNDVEKLLLFDPASTNWMDDCTQEVAMVCQVDLQKSRELIEEELRYDKLCKTRSLSISEYRKGPQLPYELHYAILQITQPLRVPGAGRLVSIKTVMDFIANDAPLGFNGSVLDYGGGGGRDCIAFARRGLKTTLLETKSYITNANEGPMIQRRFKGRNLKVDFIELGAISDVRFDYINCIDVLEHVYDVESVLAEITHRINPGGHLFIWGDFDHVTYNGDHLERNRFYARSGVWPQLFKALGYTLVAGQPGGASVDIYRFDAQPGVPLDELLIRAYRTTQSWAKQQLLNKHLKSIKPWLGTILGKNRGSALPPYMWTLQNFADTVYTLEFVTERLRNLERKSGS